MSKNAIIKQISGVVMGKYTPLLIFLLLFATVAYAAPTLIYQRDIYPEVDNTYRLGSSTIPLRWKEANVVNLNVTGTCTGCGSLSDWIQENHFGVQTLTPSTTIPVHFYRPIYASSTIVQRASTTNQSSPTYVGLGNNIEAYATINGTYNVFANQSGVVPFITAGVTNGGSYTGSNYATYRSNSTDAGSLAELRGFFSEVGHTTVNASAVTTNAEGLLINTHAFSGTISNLYGVKIAPSSSGGTLTASYGVYIDPLIGSATTSSIYANNGNVTLNASNGAYKLGFGTTSPAATFGLMGNIYAKTVSTSTFDGNGLNLTAGCFAINSVCLPTVGETSGYPFTPLTTYAVLTSATTSPVWFKSNIYASSSLIVDGNIKTTTLFATSSAGIGTASIQSGVGLDVQVASSSFAADSYYSIPGNQLVHGADVANLTTSLTSSSTKVVISSISPVVSESYYLTALPLSTQHGMPVIVRSCTLYYTVASSGLGTASVDTNRWYTINGTGVETDVDNDTTDITSGTSHVSAVSNLQLKNGEILMLEVVAKMTTPGGLGTALVTFTKSECNYDTD